VERAHIWAAGFGSYIALRFAAEYPDALGGLLTYSDVWAGDETKGYAKIWDVYSAIVRNVGTTGFGACVLANVFDVSDIPWFGAWEARNIEEVLHPETVEATVGYGLLRADVRDDLARVRAPTVVIQGNRTWDGRTLDEADDPSLALMRERIARFEVVNIPDAHPAYVLVQHPADCAHAAKVFLSRHPL
jgi:pimeloyl-ACP methyl ester carboxylesterase